MPIKTDSPTTTLQIPIQFFGWWRAQATTFSTSTPIIRMQISAS